MPGYRSRGAQTLGALYATEAEAPFASASVVPTALLFRQSSQRSL